MLIFNGQIVHLTNVFFCALYLVLFINVFDERANVCKANATVLLLACYAISIQTLVAQQPVACTTNLD